MKATSNYLLIITLYLGIAAPTVSLAATHYVNMAATNPVSPYLTIETAAETIQAAVDVCAVKDVVIVMDGTYPLATALMIEEGIQLRSMNGAEHTILEGDYSDRCLYINHAYALVDGFTITGGYHQYGGGVFFNGAGTLINCMITDNSGEYGGGVFFQRGGTVKQCTITENYGIKEAGGIFCNGGGTVTNCSIAYNRASNGGALCCNVGGKISHSHIHNNEATQAGGGILCYTGGTLENCVIENNTATSWGGGLVCYYDGHFINCQISNNTAGGYGGGARLFMGGTLQNCCINYNTSGTFGGGVYCYQGGRVENCTISDNIANSMGGGLYCSSGGTLLNSIIYFNTSPNGSNYYNSGSGGSFAYCCTAPAIETGLNIYSDNPAFMDQAIGNYRLTGTSPCVDAGQLSQRTVLVDIDGINQPVDGNLDGLAIIDIGAHEFVNSEADSDLDGMTDRWEQQYSGSTTGMLTDDDADQDGSSNLQEYLAGTDPTDASSVLRIETCAANSSAGLTFRWSSAADKTYTILHANSLDSTFTAVATHLIATPPSNEYAASAASPMGFYVILVDLD